MNLSALFVAILSVIAAGLACAQSIAPLKAGDSVMLEILRPESEAPNFNGHYTLSAKGELKLPRLETPIQAAGLSVTELAKKLAETYKAAGIYEDPAFRVIWPSCGRGVELKNVVTVGGEVKNPRGDVPLRDGMTLYQAIMAAGGFTEFADFQRVKVFRGTKQTIYDMRKIASDGSNNPILQKGDTIHVPDGTAEKSKAAATSSTPAASDTEKKAVLLKAGDSIVVQLKVPAEDAVNVSGMSLGPDGTLRLPYLKAPFQAAGLTLEEFDTRIEKAFRDAGIYRDPQFKTDFPVSIVCSFPSISIGGEVKIPRGDVPLRAGMRLNQAIMAVGGFTEFGGNRRVKLIRGKKETTYDISKIAPDGSNNPILQDGDTIHVP